MAGASGFLGTALQQHWRSTGHDVATLVRREPGSSREHRWDPYRGQLDASLVESHDVVVNLAGAPVSHWPWTAAYKKTLLISRTATTRTVAEAIAGSDHKPALVNASGVSYYGDRDDEDLDEDSSNGDTFLAKVARRWEAATEPATTAGARVCLVRTGVVLDKDGGALRLMKLPFVAGLGGTLGGGRQWFASISLADYVGAVGWVTEREECAGPYNVVAPEPATNKDLTRALSTRLHRPAVVPVPALAVRLALGPDLSNELLGSIKAHPRRLLEAGYRFRHRTIGDEVAAAFP